MNSQPSSAMENGLISQFTPTVAAMPRQCWPTSPKRARIDLQQHRHDHQPHQDGDRQVHLRDGGIADPWNTPGAAWPSAMPATMQSATQSVR